MSFAMCLGGEAVIFLFVLLFIGLLVFVALVGACIWLAALATIALAKWAAARHNRLAAERG